jgi:hypothetical protein
MGARDRFIRQVRFWLPSRCRTTLIRQIENDLDEHLDAAADEACRPLNEAEVQQALRAFGSAPVVATRYNREPPLIAGGLMTAYRKVLGIAAGGVVVVQIVLLAIAFAQSGNGMHGRAITEAGARASSGLLLAFFTVTVTFAVLTRIYRRGPDLP